jgi:hypothetical protein
MKGTWGRKTMNAKEIGILNPTPQRAALEVVRLQKSPNRNMAQTPGVINPVNS